MDKDIEDIKKLDAVIKNEHDHNNFRDEFDDFINNTITDDEEQLEGLDDEELIEIEDAVDNIFDFTGQNKYHNVDNLNFSGELNLVKNFLDLEEIKVINSCKNVKLKKLLVLNRAKHVQLQSIRYRLYELLKDCKTALKSTEDEMEKSKSQKKHLTKGIMPRLGHPYFKTKDYYSSPPNNDTLRKQKNGEICIDYLPQISRWTTEDQVILKRAITFNYSLEMIEKYESKLKTLVADKKNVVNEEKKVLLEKEISEVKKALQEWRENDKPDPPALNSSIEINWISISKLDLNDRHSPQACKAFWNIFLHPSINKGDWSDEENIAILEIARKHNYQNWEQIAVEAKTNRSGFAICVHFYTALSEKFKKDRFDPEEDQFLIDVVNSCRIGNYIPWSKVSHYFDNRSRAQLYHRYRYNLEYSDMKKGIFSHAEDILLAVLVSKFGKDFTRCCKYIPNRSPTQIGHRYNNYLAFENMSLGCWSRDEDQILLDHVNTHGEKDWSKLFSVLTMKNRTHLRQRYLHIKKWLAKNEGKTLIDMPRRTKSRRGMDAKRLELIRTCVEYFASSMEIPTLFEINERLKQMGQKPSILRSIEIRVKNDNIDKELVQFFQTTCKIRTSKTVPAQDMNHIANVVKILMTMLDVKLTIPNNVTIHSHPDLDVLDVEILSLLCKDVRNKNNTSIIVDKINDEPIASSSKSAQNYPAIIYTPSHQNHQLEKIKFSENNTVSYVPPNINTLVGMRGMLLMYQAYKYKRSASNRKREIAPAKSKVVDITEDMQNMVDSDLKTYMKRINIIFKWPALMSLMEPNQNLVFNNFVNKQPVKSKGGGKIGRPKKNLIKIELMNKARMNKYLIDKGIPTISSKAEKAQNENTFRKNISNENKTIADSCSSLSNGIEFVHVKEEVGKSMSKNQSKRNIDSTNNIQQVKKIKTERNDNLEIMQLQQDINKLDKVLLSELNDSSTVSSSIIT